MNDKGETARQKIYKKKKKKDFLNILKEINGIEFLGFENDENIVIKSDIIWKFFLRYDTSPLAKIDINEKKIESWVKKMYNEFIDNSDLLLSLGGFGILPWCKINCKNGEKDFLDLWFKIDDKDLIIYSRNNGKILGFIEDEYYYTAHIANVENFQSHTK